MRRSRGLRIVGAGIGAYVASLGVRAAHGIYLLGYPTRRRARPKGRSDFEDGGYGTS